MILEEQVVVIECRNKNERDNIVSLFQENGFTLVHPALLGACYIAAYKNTKAFSTFSKNVAHGSDISYTHNQFMEKYSNKESVMNKQLMISVINTAKEQLNIGDSELSLRLGHHRNYISRVLHQESPTAEQITKVVDKVNALIGEQKLPCGKPLPEFKHTLISDAVMVSKDEYDSLKKELDHKNQVLDKRNDKYRLLEVELNEVKDYFYEQNKSKKALIQTINELELQLKTTQQKFIDVVDQKDSEIKRLQNDCNHATNQYQGKREQVVRLNEKLNKQAVIYLTIIVIISLIGIMGFVS